jgi:hypothetical protein
LINESRNATPAAASARFQPTLDFLDSGTRTALVHVTAWRAADTDGSDHFVAGTDRKSTRKRQHLFDETQTEG